MLTALIDNGERMVSKSKSLDIVWPRQAVEEGNIHVHVSALRKLLGPQLIAPGRQPAAGAPGVYRKGFAMLHLVAATRGSA